MSSKFFGNSRQKNSPAKKGGKHKMTNKNYKQKSSGVRKAGRGSQALIHLQSSFGCKPMVQNLFWSPTNNQLQLITKQIFQSNMCKGKKVQENQYMMSLIQETFLKS